MNQRGDVLFVDDDPELLRLLSLRLELEGYTVRTCADGASALRACAERRPQALLADLRMDGLDGFALLEQAIERCPGLPVILITAHGSIPDAVTAMERGAFSFVTKPVDKDELLALLDRAVAVAPRAAGKGSWRRDILGGSKALQAMLTDAERVAASDLSVLITGASGTGKELLAQAVHRASGRAGEFVAVNCAAIPAELIESELFGHAKGAYTGASRDRQGLALRADGGTLFLDEIGELPVQMQAKLLRFLESGEVRRVGEDRALTVDARIVSATNVDLEQEVSTGRFRSDLYFRLNVARLRVPALEQRREDIPALVARRLEQLGERRGQALRMSPPALELLMQASWPGNVRELLNVVDAAAATSGATVVGVRAVERILGPRPRSMPSLAETRDDCTTDYLAAVLSLTRGNVSRAARIAGRNRTEFYKLLKRFGVEPADFKGDDPREQSARS